MDNKKVLSLGLYYKGKNLDTARESRDIKDKFVIGSDRHHQWQILDSAFPKKYTLLKKTKDKFKMFVGNKMQLTIKKGDELLDENSLKKNNYLKGNELIMNEDFNGYVKLTNDWSIAFEYVKPYKKVVTDEDRRMIQQYHRQPQPTQQEKLARNLFIIVLLVTIIGALLFDNLYTPPVFERTLATRVTVDVTPVVPEEAPVFQETIPDEPAEAAEEAVEGAEPGAGRSARDLLGFDPSASEGGPVADVPRGPAIATVSEQIVAAGPGGRPGRGPGPGGAAVTPGRAGAGFDSSAPVTSSVAPGTLFRGQIDPSKLAGRDVDASVLGGVGGDIEVTEITTSGQLAALASARQRAASAGLKTVDEAAIESAPADVKADLISIRRYVQPNTRQLDELFRQESQTRSMHGSVEITLYFAPNGQVEAAEITPRPASSFTDAFLTKAVEIMRQWRVPTQQQLPPYRFPYRFIRQ
jgi:hypothetical protein